MIVLSFKNKKDKEHLLEKAKKMEEYAAMIVDCIEDSEEEDFYQERRSYRHEPEMMDRYGYRRGM